jgi:putative DNA primase/helicase
MYISPEATGKYNLESVLYDVNQFLNLDIPVREYILKPLLSPGVLGMVHAERGIGKTYFILELCIAITRGLSIGPGETIKPTGCLYIDSEMSAVDLQKRLKDMTRGLAPEKAPLMIMSSELIYQYDEEVPSLTNPTWRNLFLDFIKDQDSLGVIVFDNLSSLAQGLDENNKEDWDQINGFLIDLRRAGKAVILIHHEGKTGKQRGTSGREDALDFSLKLSRPSAYRLKVGARFKVEFTKNRHIYGDDVNPFTLNLTTSETGRLAFESGYATMSTQKDTIITLFGNEFSQDKIVKDFGFHKSTVSKVKKEAVEKKYLDKNSLKFTDEGRKKYGHVDISGYEQPD